jgi:hypothetical protein
MTLSPKGTELEPECQFTPRVRILRTWVSTSTSANSTKKERSGQLGPRYLHIVTLSLPEWLDMAADEGAEEVRARHPTSEQTLEDVTHGLQQTGVFLGHPIPLAGLDGGALTCNHRERCINVVPQEEPLFLPSNQWVQDPEAEV